MKQVLSKEQQAIVFHNDCEGALLLEASAGSGKTRILTERVRHLLTQKKDKFFSVLCLTFTNKAADEMKERLKDIPKLSERTFIGTFHEFCLQKILRTHRNELGFETVPHIFDENDQKKILEAVLLQKDIFEEDYKSLNPKQQQEQLKHYLEAISTAKRELVLLPDAYTDWTDKQKTLYSDYNDEMLNQNGMDYDDILLYSYRILSERPSIANIYRRLYRYIMVDEAQDLNFAQYNTLKVICGDTHKNVMMIGDPKQAIYAFNGANIAFMQQDFVTDFKADKKALLHNYRSSTQVLTLAEHIRPNGGIPNNYFNGIAQIQAFDNEQNEATWVINQIKKWVQKGVYEEEEKEVISISLENIAVLARNRYVLEPLINQLDADEVLQNQYYLRKIERLSPESQLIKAFDYGLRILVNPANILHFNELYRLLKLPPNPTKKRLDALLGLNQTPELSDNLQIITDTLVKNWTLLNNNQRLIDQALLNIEQTISNTNWVDEEKLIIRSDIDEFRKYWRSFLQTTPFESQSLANFRYFLALKGIKENKKGLTLATVHTVKGLEFDIVFLIGMNQDVLPDYRAKDAKSKTEERNNAYVAITRAKRCIYVTYPKSRYMPWGTTKSQIISEFIKNFTPIFFETPI